MADSVIERAREVAFLLPGQGSQYDGMGTGLYDVEPVFTAAMDEVFAALGDDGARLRSDWLSDRPTVPLEHVTRSQPLLFAVDHALGRLVMSWGARPVALLGHSVGEVAAVVLAGGLELAAAARMMVDRVERVATGPAGGMLAVAGTPAELDPYLRDGVVIGALNAPRQVVLAGPDQSLAIVEAALRADGMTVRRMPASSPFHSPALAGVAAGSEAVIADLAFTEPVATLWSAYLPGPVDAATLRSPSHWARQPVDPVLFWPALDLMLSGGDLLLVETGPGRGLSSIARRHPAVSSGRSTAIPLLPIGTPEAERASVRTAEEKVRAALETMQLSA